MTEICKPCGQNPIDDTGNCDATTPITNPKTDIGACTTDANGKICPTTTQCSPWDITEGPEDCLISDYIQE